MSTELARMKQWKGKGGAERSGQVLKLILVSLIFTNLGLLLALFTVSIYSQESLGPESSLPAGAPNCGIQAAAGEGTTTELYPVTLNTSSLDTSRGTVRTFKAHGIASHMIIEFGAYRTGPNTFSVVALISKRWHDLHEPPYSCHWKPASSSTTSGNSETGVVNASNAWPIKPDWDLGTMYGTVVVVCTFDQDVGTAGEGGALVLTVGYSDGYRPAESFEALVETPGEYNASKWAPPFPYEITFCASRLYGDVSADRIREWMAYHAMVLGNRTRFLFHDAGGMSADVMSVLQPWIDRGWVSVQNLALLEVYQGRSHHQFTMLNDCMLRAQTLSNWTFFFDVDEYLYVPPAGPSLHQILARSASKRVTQIRMQTVKMSAELCTATPAVDDSTRDAINSRKWAFEKLVYAKCDYGWKPDETRKYALQPREAIATGVHMCEFMKGGGETWDAQEEELRLYHYHGIIPMKGEVCKEFTSGTDGSWITNCSVDHSMIMLVEQAKQFERNTLGNLSFIH